MAVTWKKLAYEDDVITKATLTAKGDIISASASATPSVLGVGSNDQILVADSAQASGLKWAALPSASLPAHASSHMLSGSDEIDLDELGVPDGAIDCGGQELEDAVIDQESTAPTAVKGKIYYDTDDDSAYICTSAA